DGFWSLLFPLMILGGIYLGIFNAVESAAMSVVYALVVELFLHRALKFSDLPKVFQETALLLGSLLVILVVATSLGEFLEGEGIPELASEWVGSMNLSQWQFLIVINLLLLVVGCLMDIMSAIFIFVPLLAPMAATLGVHPIHFAIVFIVNLEIGYLTPPVGLNLFVASTLFNKPLGFLIKSVLPFILVMFACLMVITYWPGLTKGGADLVMGEERGTGLGSGTGEIDEGDEGATPAAGEDAGPRTGPTGARVQTLEEMMAEQEAEAARLAAEEAADAGAEAEADSGAADQAEQGAEADGGAEPTDEEADPEPSF
ncbi:MAG: TRAP transporter large permease subunit, partial [Deltaproteobacteria bacterium]|nr:TRAP transporter large permease subunit [Deltaproteobacteria bacterium]